MFRNISPDSVRSGRTCPANLGVRSCPVRKLICPVRSSPKRYVLPFNKGAHKDVRSNSIVYIIWKGPSKSCLTFKVGWLELHIEISVNLYLVILRLIFWYYFVTVMILKRAGQFWFTNKTEKALISKLQMFSLNTTDRTKSFVLQGISHWYVRF